jgi:hypothetical protein
VILERIIINVLFFVGSSYNQPKFCSSATWNPDAITFANSTTVGLYPVGIFVTINNMIFVVEETLNRVQVWLEGNVTAVLNISTGLNSPLSVFASNTDAYVDNGMYNGQVGKWSINVTNSTAAMYVNSACYSLFVDIYDNLYCCLGNLHKVVKKSFNDDANTTQIVAGNGSAGSASNMLNNPRGIFVDLNFNLYVADCNNNRVQFFQPGYLNATTIVGNGSSGTITINCPIGVLIDADENLFILEFNNSRILELGPNGLKCIAACTNISGSASNQLNGPSSFSFDSYGNIYVADEYNSRIQKFLLNNDSCGKFYININD